MLTAGIAILTGAIIACFPPFPVASDWYFLLPLCLLLAYFNQRGRFIWLCLCSMLWTSLQIHLQLQQDLPQRLHNKEISLQGEVIDLPRVGAYATRFLLRVETEQSPPGMPTRLRLSWRNPPMEIEPGQRWQFNVRLKPAHGYQNPGGFDYERWLFVQGIHATGYVIAKSPAELLDSGGVSVDRVRHQVNRWIEQHCVDCRQQGLMQALTTGYRGNIAQATRDLLQQTGSAHLIAVSGLHIGIVAGLFLMLGGIIWRLGFYRFFPDLKDFALGGGLIAATLYALLAGFALPAQRALIMLAVVVAVQRLRLPFNLASAVMLSLVVILVWAPLSVLSASFWLTFSALVIIMLAVFLLPQHMSRWKQMLVIQLLFSLLFIPLTLIIFDQVHSASFVANLLAVPLVSLLIVPFNFLLLALFWIPDGWLQLLYGLLDQALGFLLWYLNALQGAGLEAMEIRGTSPWLVLVLGLWFLLLVVPRGLRLTPTAMWLLPLVAMGHAWPRERPDLTVSVLDVGMGTAIVVETRHHSLVYDFGPGNLEGYSLGQWVVQPYLQHRGVNRIDRLIISHADQDHMGGLLAVAGRYKQVPVSTGTVDLIQNKLPALQQIKSCHQQDSWYWDGVEFSFLQAPMVGGGRSKNNRSCVLSIRLGERHILLPGDIEASQERWLLMRYGSRRLAADVLVTPHHGSLTSSSHSFVRAVQPESVIHTVGFYNRWRFPRPEVVRRYQAVGAAQYRTDLDGAVLIECEPERCEVSSYRRQNPRFWY